MSVPNFKADAERCKEVIEELLEDGLSVVPFLLCFCPLHELELNDDSGLNNFLFSLLFTPRSLKDETEEKEEGIDDFEDKEEDEDEEEL